MAQADCPRCGGTGWRIVERSRALAHARTRPLSQADLAHLSDADVLDLEDGSPIPAGERQGPSPLAESVAMRCDCVRAERAARSVARARIPRRYEHCDIENFDTDIYENASWNRSLEQVKLFVEGFARDYPVAGECGLLLTGPCGTGKTHLAVGALRSLVLRGHDGLFYDYRELLKEIQASYNPESQSTEMGVLEPVLAAELLLLDDLGASKPSAWALETVGHILNTRYNERRVTMLTTNYLDSPAVTSEIVEPPPGQAVAPAREEALADRIGQRIRSRLYEMCRTVELVAPDYRKEIRQAGRLRS